MKSSEFLEHQRQEQQFQNNADFFDLSKDPAMIEEELVERYRVKFEN